jgi:hypothetical protein
VQVGVENLAFAEEGILLGERLLHLHDHVGALEDLAGGGDDLGAALLVILVRDSGAEAGVLLDEDGVAVLTERADARQDHADAVFLVLDLLRNADDHRLSLPIFIPS